jgi:hypothetical protein
MAGVSGFGGKVARMDGVAGFGVTGAAFGVVALIVSKR